MFRFGQWRVQHVPLQQEKGSHFNSSSVYITLGLIFIVICVPNLCRVILLKKEYINTFKNCAYVHVCLKSSKLFLCLSPRLLSSQCLHSLDLPPLSGSHAAFPFPLRLFLISVGPFPSSLTHTGMHPHTYESRIHWPGWVSCKKTEGFFSLSDIRDKALTVSFLTHIPCFLHVASRVLHLVVN